MRVEFHRIYDDDPPAGYRVLVDCLWPRGISKDEANLDGHWKQLAPSSELRKWFDHEPDRWNGFRKKYLAELSENKGIARELLHKVSGNTLVLLYAAKDREHTHARVLTEYLEKLT